jgi:hypothetical protein
VSALLLPRDGLGVAAAAADCAAALKGARRFHFPAPMTPLVRHWLFVAGAAGASGRGLDAVGELGSDEPVELRVHRVGDELFKSAVHRGKLVVHLRGDELGKVDARHKAEFDELRGGALRGVSVDATPHADLRRRGASRVKHRPHAVGVLPLTRRIHSGHIDLPRHGYGFVRRLDGLAAPFAR